MNKIKEDKGVTLTVLIVTIIIMLLLVSVSFSLLIDSDSIENKLETQSNILNEFYNTSNEIQSNIKNELNTDYDNINNNIEVDNNQNNYIIKESIWNGSVNTPQLLEGMTAIYYDNENEIVLSSESTQEEWNNWFDYRNKMWANAKTSDGSYWVWIPRYAYKITSNAFSNVTGDVSIIFVDNNNQNAGVTYSTQYPNVSNNMMEEYVVHPAFLTNLDNGGNDNNISGFWVAKYEVSMEKSLNGGTTWEYADGVNTITKNAGNTSSIRVVSKPDVSSWRNITIGNAYTNAYYYNLQYNSHMMKNSEWGAVVYLAHSSYGRDGDEITKNSSNEYITKTGGNLASTTGNITGVFDMNGGAYEFVSAYILNTTGTVYRNEYASSFANSNVSSKFSTVYLSNETSDTSENNWNKYKESFNFRFGDAVLEISNSGTGNSSWHNDISVYPFGEKPFIIRGGCSTDSDSDSGIFMYSRAKGNEETNIGYRIVLN